MNRKWVWIGAAVMVILAVGAYSIFQQMTAEPGPAVPAGPVRGETEAGIRAEGRVVPARHAVLAYVSGGVVTNVFVSEGDGVQMGDPLLQLEITDEAIAVRTALAAVALAEANLAGVEAGLEVAQIGLASAQLAVRDAQADLALLSAGATAEQIALAEANVALAEAGIELAAGSRAVALAGATRAEIAAAQAQLAYAQTVYDNALSSNQPILQNEDSDAATREQAFLRLNAAQAALTAAQSALARLLAGATAAEQRAGDSGVSVAANQRDGAQAGLDLLLAGARSEEIAIVAATVTSAETAVAAAEGRVASAGTAIAQAEAALLEARAGLAAAETEMGKRTLLAPFDGTIAAVRTKTGETIATGMPVIVLADFSQWQIETTDLTELNVTAVTEGLPVAVQIDAFPGVTLRGNVSAIAATAADVLGDVTYVTTIDLPDSSELSLRWGMTAFVNVLTAGQTTLPENNVAVLPVPRIEAEGQVVPHRFVNVSFATGGRTAAIPVNEADSVPADAVLIELEAEALRLALDQAGARTAAAEASVMAAQSQLSLAQTAVVQAESVVTIAQGKLALTSAAARPEEVAAAEAALAAAEAAAVQAQAERDVALDTISAADIAGAEANLAAATADLRALEDAYQQILDTCFDTPDGQTVCPFYGPVEEQARRGLETAQANQAAAAALLDGLNAGPTPAQRAAAAAAVTFAGASRDVAQAQLNLLLAGVSPERIEKAEIGVAQAELGVAVAVADVLLAETVVAQAEAALAGAVTGREAVQAALNRMALRAPVAGTVTGLSLNPGEMVAPAVPVATIADQSGWLVETTDVAELDAPYIAVGATVMVHFDAIADRNVAGTVTKIALMPGVFQGDVVYQVTVQLAASAADLPLRWGLTAVVVFE